MSIENEEVVIYNGSRGKDFKDLIFNLLVTSKLKIHYIDLLMNDESMKIYDNVFTSDSADPEKNYEVYEQFGDITANKFIVWYMHRRFPKLMCPQGVKVVARLRINYGAKQSFASIADGLGFWDFITASEDERSRNKKPLLEDVFEAFIGATEFIIDSHIKECVGYSVAYNILGSIFDKIDISLKYEDLYDAKTRLKELYDFFGSEVLGALKYETIKCEGEKINRTNVYQIYKGRSYKLGEGVASLKGDSEQRAASFAIQNMKNRGYYKPVPEIYSFFS
jgi:dsRNA-specific ribonuclease